MKQRLKNVINVTALLALVFTVSAQEASNPKPDAPGGLYERMGQERVELLKDTANASAVLGMTVRDQKGEKLAKVHDLYVNLKSGRIVEIILTADSGKLTAVPPQVLHHSADEKTLRLDVSNEKFLAAPQFNPTMPDALTESNLVAAVYVYYGEEAYFVANPEGLWTTNANGTLNRDGMRDTNQVRNAAIDRHVADDSNTVATRDPDGKQTGNYYSPQNQAINSWSSLGNVRRIKGLMGMSVRNLQGVKLAKVHDFIVDLAAGRLAAVILTSGGFLGLGCNYNAAPATSFAFDPKRGGLQLDATSEMLDGSSAFRVDEWPNFPLAGYTNGEYFPYRVAPYNNTIPSDAAANSGPNVRSQDNRMLAKVTQGTSQSDKDLLAQVRQAVTNDGNLSVNAKHVLIITANGRVTLRGPVNTSDEKRIVGEIAERIARSGNVDNELEVQLTTTN